MAEKIKKDPILLSVDRIWDKAHHSSLTDLIKWKGDLYCTFREADKHYSGINGIIRILKSTNGVIWELVSTLDLDGWDLRDPKLSIVPDGRLMLLVGASKFKNKERLAHQTHVCFSEDGDLWTPFQPIFDEEWLWRVTWFQGIGYGISYFLKDFYKPKGEWSIRLYQTEDGLSYKPIGNFDIPGRPCEATLRFYPNGQMVALLRRDARENNHAWLGTSYPPYEDWLWAEAPTSFGGPNFLILPNLNMWACGRIVSNSPYGVIEKTALAEMTLTTLEPKLILPSGGDTSYPGMVYEHPFLWISYYSSHEKNTAIYIAKVALE